MDGAEAAASAETVVDGDRQAERHLEAATWPTCRPAKRIMAMVQDWIKHRLRVWKKT